MKTPPPTPPSPPSELEAWVVQFGTTLAVLWGAWTVVKFLGGY